MSVRDKRGELPEWRPIAKRIPTVGAVVLPASSSGNIASRPIWEGCDWACSGRCQDAFECCWRGRVGLVAESPARRRPGEHSEISEMG